MLEVSYRPRVVYGFYRGEGRSDGTLVEKGRNVDDLVAVCCHLNVGREECC